MEKSFFFNSVTVSGVPDRSYTAEDIAERTACLISDGVMSGDSLKVTGCPAAGVYVAPGAACISGYTYINKHGTKIHFDHAACGGLQEDRSHSAEA